MHIWDACARSLEDSGAVRLFGAPLLKAPQAVGLSSMPLGSNTEIQS